MNTAIPAISPNAVYSRADIARLIGKSSDVVKSWERRYGLPRIAAPGHPRYRGSDVLAVIRQAIPLTDQPKRPRGLTPEEQRALLVSTR